MPGYSLTTDQFVAAMEHSPIGTAIVAQNGRWLWTNLALTSILGYSKAEFSKTNFQTIIHPDDLLCEIGQMRQLIEGEIPIYEIERRYIKKDGSAAWCLMTMSAVKYSGRDPDFFIFNIQDVGQRKADDAERAVLIERLSLATRNSGIRVWEWDILSQTLIFDDQMCQLYGTDRLTTTPCNDIFWSAIHPDHLERVRFELGESLAGRSECDTEIPIKTLSGEFRQLRTRAIVIRDASGAAIRMIGTNRDITAEWQQSAVQHQRDLFQAAIQAVEGVLWTNDAEGRMVGVQPAWAALTGQSFAEYQGYGWASAVHPDDAASTIEAWNQAVAERRTFRFEHRVKRHDGRWRICAIRAVPLIDPSDGCIIEWVGIHTDVTVQRQAEDELSALNLELEARVSHRTARLQELSQQLKKEVMDLELTRREAAIATAKQESLQAQVIHLSRVDAMGAMASTLAHELNQPLAAIALYVGGLKRMLEQGATPQMMIEPIAQIEEVAMRAGDLIRSIREMTGKSESNKQPFIPDTIIEKAGELTGVGVDHRANVQYDFQDGVPVMGDPIQIQQVMINLIRNALQAVAGRLSQNVFVRTRIAGDNTLILIEDDGAGISRENFPRLFDAHFSTKHGDGMGIGLSICRTIVEEHSGKIWAENLPEGGARFSIMLPLAKKRPVVVS